MLQASGADGAMHRWTTERLVNLDGPSEPPVETDRVRRALLLYAFDVLIALGVSEHYSIRPVCALNTESGE